MNAHGVQGAHHDTTTQRSSLSQRPENKGKSLQATIDSMVGSIEPGAQHVDLLKDDRHTAGTIGITMTSDQSSLAPMHVMSVTVGGPAYISGQIAQGDEVVAVDGKRSQDKDSLLEQVRNPDLLGSTVLLTVKRGNMELDVPLVRTSAAHVKDVSTTFTLLKELSGLVEQMASAEDFLSTLQTLILHTVDMERNRLQSESQLSKRIVELQERLERKERLVKEMIQEVARVKAAQSAGAAQALRAPLGTADTAPPPISQRVAFTRTQEEIQEQERKQAEVEEIKKRNAYLEVVIASTTQDMANLHNKVEETLLAKNALFEAEMGKKTQELYAVFQEELRKKSEETEALRQRVEASQQELSKERAALAAAREELAREREASAARQTTTHVPAVEQGALVGGEDGPSVMAHSSSVLSRVNNLDVPYPAPSSKQSPTLRPPATSEPSSRASSAPSRFQQQLLSRTASAADAPPREISQAPAESSLHNPTPLTDANPAPRLPLNMVPSPPPKAYPQTPPLSTAASADSVKLQPMAHGHGELGPSPSSAVPSLRLPPPPSPGEQAKPSLDAHRRRVAEEEWGLHTVLRHLAHSTAPGNAASSQPLPQTDPRPRRAGVGMLLHKLADKDFPYVKDIVPSGVADRDGRIRKGEFLLAIDQVSVEGLPLHAVVDKIAGIEDTAISLTLQRERETGGKEIFNVRLVRKRASGPLSEAASRPGSVQERFEAARPVWGSGGGIDLNRVSPRPVDAPPDSAKQ